MKSLSMPAIQLQNSHGLAVPFGARKAAARGAGKSRDQSFAGERNSCPSRRLNLVSKLAMALVSCALAAALTSTTGWAGSKSAKSRSFKVDGLSGHPLSRYYRRGTRVRGFRLRIGGYSYSSEDSLLNWRDTDLLVRRGRVPQGLPFDSGFFFDSGSGGFSGNDSPYLN